MYWGNNVRVYFKYKVFGIVFSEMLLWEKIFMVRGKSLIDFIKVYCIKESFVLRY